MKVVHILRKYVPTEWGGTESAVLSLVKNLNAYGVDSEVFSPIYPYLPKSGQAEDAFETEGISMRAYKAYLPVVGISAKERESRWSVGGNILSFDLLWRLLREPDVDVIHTHALGRIGGVARCAARLRHIPYVATIHGGYLDVPEGVQFTSERGVDLGQAFGWLVGSRRVIGDAGVVTCMNEKEHSLLSARFPSKVVLEMQHDINVDDYSIDCRDHCLERNPELTGKRVISSIGRIDPVKNQLWLVRAMKNLMKMNRDIVLVLVGPVTNAGYFESLVREIESAGLKDRILLLGLIPPRDRVLIGLLQLSRAVVLPSVSETFGLVLLEAWAANVPVVSSCTSGGKRHVKDGENGFLFELDDEREFEQKLLSLIEQVDLARKMAAAGNDYVRQKYGASESAAAMYRAYCNLTRKVKE